MDLVIKQLSVMDQNEKYQYKFQYSLANYHPNFSGVSEEEKDFFSQDEQTILRRSNELIDFRCFLSKETEQIIRTLFTHFIQLYGKVAVRLFTICERTYQNMDMSSSSFIKKFQETLDYQRQKLVQNLAELSRIFEDDKQKYLKLISLCIASSIFKILTLQKQVEDIEFETVFHTVYWEITGTHSTSQILKRLLGETFNGINFHNYLINEEITKSYKVQSISQSMIKNSVSFINDKPCNANQNLNYSVKNIDTRKINLEPNYKGEMAFSKIIKRKEKLSKENSSSYLNYYQADPVSGLNKPILCNQTKDFVCQFTEIDFLKSNKKIFNFKKDRTTINEKDSKTKSRNKIINDFGSLYRNPSFASCLEQKQKKLKF